MRRLVPLLFCAAPALIAGCTNFLGSSQISECIADRDCENGSRCVSNSCVILCFDDSECPAETPTCFQRQCVAPLQTDTDAALSDMNMSVDAEASDAGLEDAAAPDAEMADAEIPDVEIPDAELPDAEIDDAALDDAALDDAALGDASIPDMEIPDAELPDAELLDMEAPDAELGDAEIPDVEVP
ncbi:MAG: hypothetical protein ACE366_25070 [Bradymonadia bacterium]